MKPVMNHRRSIISVCILIGGLLVVVGPANASSTATLALNPLGDAYVLSSFPNDPQNLDSVSVGAAPVLDVGFQPSSDNNTIATIAFLEFQLPSDVGGANYTGATVISLYVNSTASSDGSPVQINAYSTSGVKFWNDSTLSFVNAPRILAKLSSAAVSGNGTYYSWDVTNATKSAPGGSVMTVALVPLVVPGKEQHVLFNSEEARANHPKLSLGGVPATPSSASGIDYRVVGIVAVAFIAAAGALTWWARWGRARK